MKLTFDEIGINVAEFNGLSAKLARQCIINTTINFILNTMLYNVDTEETGENIIIPWPEDAGVDFVNHTVDIYVNMAYITIH